MSYVDFMASVLMLMTAMAPAAAVIQSRKFSNHQDLADVSFADGVTFESQARSTVDCLRICSAKSCCCRFTFVESGSIRGACRGYRTQLTYGSSRTSAVGSKTFVLLWEQTSGKTRQFLPTSLSHCYFEISVFDLSSVTGHSDMNRLFLMSHIHF